MKLGFSILIVLFGPLLAYPVPSLTTPTNSSVAYDKFGITDYVGADMEQLLDEHPIFLRDTVSYKFVEFDIPRGATGFYPVVITFSSTTALSFVSINSTSNVNISLYKCKKVLSFGKITRGHILFDKAEVQELETEKCGRKWKNQFIKLVISPENKRAQGYARVDGHYHDVNGTQSFFALIGLSIGCAVILLLFLISICVSPCKKTNPTIPPEWPQSESFDYRQRYSYIPQEPIPMLPLRRTMSQVTIFEHEREEMQMALQQRGVNRYNNIPAISLSMLPMYRSNSQITIFEHEREEMALALQQRLDAFRQQHAVMVSQHCEYLAHLRELEDQEELEELDEDMMSASSEEYTGVEYEDEEDHPEF